MDLSKKAEQPPYLLAVSRGNFTTLIYKMPLSVVEQVVAAGNTGQPWNTLLETLNLHDYFLAASNAADEEAAQEALDLEENADFFIDLDDPDTWRDVAEQLAAYNDPDDESALSPREQQEIEEDDWDDDL